MAMCVNSSRNYLLDEENSMKFSKRRIELGLLAVLLLTAFAEGQQSAPQHLFFPVTLPLTFDHPIAGRLLLFVQQGKDAKQVDMNQMAPNATYVAAKEIASWTPGTTMDIDADDLVFPQPLSNAPAGDYQAQAVLDIHHTYNYVGRQPGEPISAVVSLAAWNPAKDAAPALTLSGTQPAAPAAPKPAAGELQGFDAAVHPIDFVSPALTAFWGKDIHMKGWVLTPPGYAAHPGEHYPTVYFTHGFGGTLNGLRDRYAPMLYERMLQKKMPEMIWVLLDESSPTGTHEFADGVNNGPWGTALTTELIPYIESQYRMDGRASGRFLNGHSSGGWATLWLQTTYPKVFGGTWSTSPDPSDFHAFSTIDLYAPHANFYRAPDGTAVPIMRDHGQVLATMEQLAKQERVLGDNGGQIRSFEWVFSPRAKDGSPMPLFDRATGEVNTAVAAYWGSHYDIAHRVEANWSILAPDLKGKIHLIVGTADTFYLDGAAHRFQQVLDRLGAQPHFTFLPGKTHFDLYAVERDRYALFDTIAAEMYAIARPGK